MVKFFVSMIKQGKITIEQVPEEWRESVTEALDSANPDFHIDSDIVDKAEAFDYLTGRGDGNGE